MDAEKKSKKKTPRPLRPRPLGKAPGLLPVIKKEDVAIFPTLFRKRKAGKDA